MGLTKHGQGEILREQDDTPAKKEASQQDRERVLADVVKEGEEVEGDC